LIDPGYRPPPAAQCKPTIPLDPRSPLLDPDVMRHSLENWTDLVLLSLMWGTAFLFIKIAVDVLPPATVVAARLGGAAVVLLVFARSRGLTLPRGGRLWGHLFLLSLFGNTIPFFLITWGQQSVDSGLTAMLLAGMPLATLLLAHLFVPGERMSAGNLAGFLVGLVGIVILVGPNALRTIGGDRTEVVSQLAIVAAALCYAVNAILARLLPPGDAVTHTTATICLAALTTLPFGIAQAGSVSARLTPALLLALTWLGLVSTALATVVYFRIIASAGPTFLSLINYLIPPIAVIVGAVVLGEEPAPSALTALVVTLIGIAISQRSTLRAQARR
jgi:drug/metabolite transporter (DMT)-like permease